MIVIVAPYSPPDRVGDAHLGASRKLEAIISILSRIDAQLILVNSAHNGNWVAPISVTKSMVGGVNLIEITLPTLSSRPVGKLKNIFSVNQVIEELKKLGVPQLIWLYNGYAFEMCFAEKARLIFNVPMVFEFEDWHFSRNRGLNPKPWIDYLLWRKVARHMSATFAVNSFLAAKMKKLNSNVELLPGVVPTALASIAFKYPPFCVNKSHINVGFFGGLSAEKGADIVLQLVDKLLPGFTLQVTGAGPLESAFTVKSRMRPDSLHFHSRVDDATLYQLISECDVILNPHASIENMGNGVFPFKVIEAIASGRLLISTKVLATGLEDVMAGVLIVEPSQEAFFSAVTTCREYYRSNGASITQCAKIANQRFGEDALLGKVRALIQGWTYST